ncbi:MAG: hypothetical protein IJ083_02355 [Clostridia bacterium]|nr:hypothetical protein [Clostridia bacterium]
MTNWKELTVLELRKAARERHIPVKAGANKAYIVQLLEEDEAAAGDAPAPSNSQAPKVPDEAVLTSPAENAASEDHPAEDVPVETPPRKKPRKVKEPVAVQLSLDDLELDETPDGTRESQPGAEPAPKPSAPVEEAAPSPREEQPKWTARFGPGAAAAPRPHFGPAARLSDEPPRRFGPYPSPAPSEAPAPHAQEESGNPVQSGHNAFVSPFSPSIPAPSTDTQETPEEATLTETKGYLELTPEGYGFLRSAFIAPSVRDAYLSSSLVRRFGLKWGDEIRGPVRPPRDGDRFPTVVDVTEVNGETAVESPERPTLDDRTPIYPERHLDLGRSRFLDMRLLDLVLPVGYGQRALLIAPPDAGKARFLTHLAAAAQAADPFLQVITLILDKTPEDCTAWREAAKGTVFSATFDMPPDVHLRMSQMAQERASRLLEDGKDVMLIVDSLTRLSKLSSSPASLTRSAGGINQQSLMRAKRLLASGRELREAGSLTVVGVLDVENGNRTDDSLVSEFRESANLEIVFDSSITRSGLYPGISLVKSSCQQRETLSDPDMQQVYKAIQDVTAGMNAAPALSQILAFLQAVPDNHDLPGALSAWVRRFRS